jgi:hypothetical protein
MRSSSMSPHPHSQYSVHWTTNSAQLSWMFPNLDVAWTWILPEQGRVKVSHRLSGGEPVTASQDFEFLPHCCPEIYAAVHFSHFNPLNVKLNPIFHLLALLGAHPILHISRISVKDHIPKDVVHEIGDLGRTLDFFCGFDDVLVFLTKCHKTCLVG